MNYDDRTHKLTGYNYEIQIDKVIETPIIQEYSLEEIKIKDENDKMNILKIKDQDEKIKQLCVIKSRVQTER